MISRSTPARAFTCAINSAPSLTSRSAAGRYADDLLGTEFARFLYELPESSRGFAPPRRGSSRPLRIDAAAEARNAREIRDSVDCTRRGRARRRASGRCWCQRREWRGLMDSPVEKTLVANARGDAGDPVETIRREYSPRGPALSAPGVASRWRTIQCSNAAMALARQYRSSSRGRGRGS